MWCQKIDWYDRFNVNEASSSLWAATRELKSLDTALTDVIADSYVQVAQAKILKEATKLGFDPRYWFSSERSAKKVELESAQKGLTQLSVQLNFLYQKNQETKDLVGKQQADLDRYRSFDRLEAEATVKALTVQIGQLNVQLEEVQPPKDRVDQQLMEPLAELNKLKQRKSGLEMEIVRAKDFERRLSSAENGYDRKKIHDSCDANFGESKPAKVIRDKQKELESVNRNIGKLHDRLCLISARATRVIKALVIDGNNLCYQQQTFIGLAALQVVAQRLSSVFTVVIVFDASIRVLLKMNDRDIAAQFGNSVQVHVVSSKNKADETVLDTAVDISAYVISNDRFGDYPDKPAVRDKRLIRHEILNGRVFIHDLNVAEVIATAV